jgi:hypothetical protein
MNLRQHDACSSFLAKLLETPCASIFWLPSPPRANTVINPYSFQMISHRLAHGRYAEPDQMINDIRALLQNAVASERGMRLYAAQYLATLFERLLVQEGPAHPPAVFPVVQLEERVAAVAAEFGALRSLPPVPRTPARPAAELLRRNAMRDLPVQDLLEMAMALSPGALGLVITRFLIQKQPECVIFGPKIEFNVVVMSEETQKQLHKFLRRLLTDVASGRLNS